VNGSGLAALDLGGNAPAVSYFYDPAIFSHRTETTLVRTGAGLTVHLYFNQMLNDVNRSALKIGGISLVSFIPQTGEYAFIMPPFQERNPDWEAVGFAAPATGEYYFEWKMWGEDETRFAYTAFRSDTGKETPITRDEYLGKLKAYSASAPAGAPLRKALFAKVRGILQLEESSTVHFIARSREEAVKLVFRGGEGATTIIMIPVWEESGRALALLPEGRVVSTADGATFDSVSLPPLPAGFSYTDLYMDDGALIVPWEQTLFTDVRAAGLLIFRP
jgi:hypothetical protein